jgi:ABC-type Mn2+/Zn2+ transport system ATPase subunit
MTAVSGARPRLLPYCRQHPPAEAGAPAIEAAGLGVTYPQAERPALERVDWQVPRGARVALVGPNGCGKSTLLRSTAGLLAATAGRLRVYGLPPGTCRHRVAYLPQRSDLDWRFPIDVRALVLGGRYVHLGWLRRPGRADREAAAAQLERLGLVELAGRQIGQLSGGQQQRALLARALAQEADLLLLDEPFTAVDAATRDVLLDVLDDLKREGRTVVVATHDLDRDRSGFDGVLGLREGRVAEVDGLMALAGECVTHEHAAAGHREPAGRDGVRAWAS